MYIALKLVRRLLLRPAEVNLTLLYIGEQNTPAWQRQRRIAAAAAVVEGGQRQHRRRDIRQSSSCLLYSSLEWGSHNNNITNKLEAPLCGLCDWMRRRRRRRTVDRPSRQTGRRTDGWMDGLNLYSGTGMHDKCMQLMILLYRWYCCCCSWVSGILDWTACRLV